MTIGGYFIPNKSATASIKSSDELRKVKITSDINQGNERSILSKRRRIKNKSASEKTIKTIMPVMTIYTPL